MDIVALVFSGISLVLSIIAIIHDFSRDDIVQKRIKNMKGLFLILKPSDEYRNISPTPFCMEVNEIPIMKEYGLLLGIINRDFGDGERYYSIECNNITEENLKKVKYLLTCSKYFMLVYETDELIKKYKNR